MGLVLRTLVLVRCCGPLSSRELAVRVGVSRADAVLALTRLMHLGHVWALEGDSFDVTRKGREYFDLLQMRKRGQQAASTGSQLAGDIAAPIAAEDSW